MGEGKEMSLNIMPCTEWFFTLIINVAAALQVNSTKPEKPHLSLLEGKGVSQPRTALLSVHRSISFVTH